MAQVIAPQTEQKQQTTSNPLQNLSQKTCFVCKKNEGQLLRCSRCKKIYYCGSECQKADWTRHKIQCKNQQNKITNDKQNTKVKKQKQEGLNQFGKLTHVGTGNFSIIYKTTSNKDGKTYAIKQVQKAKVQRMRKQADVFMEKHCLNKLKECDYVIKLYKTFQDELSLYFQMQFPEKGQLWEVSKVFGIIPNSIFKYYVSHIVKSISTLHNQYQIVHRDLKPQNILIDKDNKIKLIDFGTAKDLDRPDIKGSGNGLKGKKPFEHYVGTAHYMAPECIHNKASQKKSDIYSLSGVFFFLKVGSPPFQGGSQYLTFTKSLQTQLFTCKQIFDENLQDLIKKMNSKQMDKRINIDQVISHPYFEGLDFQNLPTYAQSLQKVSQQQKYLQSICQKLLKIMESEKQPKIERRKQIYQKQIKPIMQNLLIQNKQKEHMLKKLDIIDIQCQCFLNIRDDNNISFTEIYKQIHPEPVPVLSMNSQATLATNNTSNSDKDILDNKQEEIKKQEQPRQEQANKQKQDEEVEKQQKIEREKHQQDN